MFGAKSDLVASFVVSGGVAITTALFTKTIETLGLRGELAGGARNGGESVRSRFRNLTFVEGTTTLISAMAASALEGVRAAKQTWDGLCFASSRTVSCPGRCYPGRIWASFVAPICAAGRE